MLKIYYSCLISGCKYKETNRNLSVDLGKLQCLDLCLSIYDYIFQTSVNQRHFMLPLLAHVKAMDITEVFAFCSPGEMVRQVQ